MSLTLSLTQELIRCHSITPHDGGCQKIIGERLSALKFKLESLPFADVQNLWARFGTKEPLLVFSGHTDVVPPGPLENWNTDPFIPTVKKGFLYGRGAADMKSGLAAMIVATENFMKKNPNFEGSIGFLITSDEEGQSINGTRKVLEELNKRKEKITYCLIGEASSAETVGDQIRIGRRGSLHGKLFIYGRQGHVAYPEKAANAIHNSGPLINALHQEIWDEGNTEFPPTTFQISNIHAGTGALNVIPGSLEMNFNFRFGNINTAEALQQRLENILKKLKLNYDCQWELSGEPFVTSQGKLLDSVKKSIYDVIQIEPLLSTAGGTSDGRFFAPLGVEVIELGPCHHSVHQANEHVCVKDLEILTQMYEKILTYIF